MVCPRQTRVLLASFFDYPKVVNFLLRLSDLATCYRMGKGGYGTVDFWDEYYVIDRPEPYDWFFGCSFLEPLLRYLLREDEEILMVGCGNSPFSTELRELGFARQVNVDNCALVIEQQRKRDSELVWDVADVRELPYSSGRFDVVFDKVRLISNGQVNGRLKAGRLKALSDQGLLDNLYCYRDPEENCARALSDMSRTLRPGGRLIVISCHDENEVRYPAWSSQARTSTLKRVCG